MLRRFILEKIPIRQKMNASFSPFRDKMQSAGLSEAAIAAFEENPATVEMRKTEKYFRGSLSVRLAAIWILDDAKADEARKIAALGVLGQNGLSGPEARLLRGLLEPSASPTLRAAAVARLGRNSKPEGSSSNSPNLWIQAGTLHPLGSPETIALIPEMCTVVLLL